MDTKDWNIRKANIRDADPLKKCMELAYEKYVERLGGKQLPPMLVDYKEEIASFPVWIAEEDNEVVGGLILMYENSYITIANVAVRPDFQGKGLGRVLLDFAESKAKAKGYSEIRLATHVLLTENISYYIHLGWKEIDRDDTRIYMSKKIAD